MIQESHFQLQDHFRDSDMQEFRRMQRDLGSLAKTCRNLQLKLRRTQQQQLLKAREQEEELKAAAAAALGGEPDPGPPPPPPRSARSSLSDLSVKKTVPIVYPVLEPEPEPEPENESGGELWRSAAIW